MGLKPDHWIRKMAREQGMIEPFEDSQVRNGVISYGVSSYGYDIRVADEFKIFTNVFSAVVDPKQFDPRSMVDFQGEICVIPPNSFALARTIEYFRIPRSVLTVCLGKCLTGDTRIVDADTGDYLRLDEFVAKGTPSTIALDGSGLGKQSVSAHLENGLKPVFRLVTESGLQIKATAQHPFLTQAGWTPLQSLRQGDRVAVAATCPVFGANDWPGYEAVLAGLMLSAGRRLSPTQGFSFPADDPVVIDTLIKAATSWSEHAPIRNEAGVKPASLPSWLEGLGCDTTPEKRGIPRLVFTSRKEAVAQFLQAIFSGGGSVQPGLQGEAFLAYGPVGESLAFDLHHLLLRFGVFTSLRRVALPDGSTTYQVEITDPGMLQRFACEIGFLPGSRKQALLEQAVAEVEAALQPTPAGTLQAAAISSHSVVPTTVLGAGEGDIVWDAVVSVEPVGVERVYDLTVPGLHNFLANDMIVHNSTYARCGIIVNVTPFEPEWEGYVTLEISNTTPLPARIYANEGIAQVLFFEADEECEISYADKKGKYQKQQSIVLPKM